MVKSHLKRIARQVLHEGRVHVQRLREPRGRPSVMVFPSNQPWDPASKLRAWELAPALRERGWRVVVGPAPLGLAQRRRLIALEKPDVILLQQTRHTLNRPDLFRPIPCVIDADDADYLDPRYQVDIAQRATDAVAVVGGSRFVADCLGRHNADATVIWTATPIPKRRAATRAGDRGPIVAWAHAEPFGYRDEAELVQRVLLRVAKHTPFTFWLFGTKPGTAEEYFEPLRRAGVQTEAIPKLSYEDYLTKVSEAAVGLQPVCVTHEFSRGKSFGKILAYLSGEVPVVASNVVDHPLFFEHGATGMLAADDGEWEQAILRLLREPDLRSQMASRAYEQFVARLSMPAFAAAMDAVLRRAAARTPMVA